jgi:endoglucanase
LIAVGVLVAASAYGLSRGHGPATLNNVAFAALHSSILLIGAVPALRLRHSPLLAPDESGRPTRSRRRRPWPKPVWLSALGLVLLIPVLLSTLGTQALRMPTSLNQQAYQAVRSFLGNYVAPDGRVIRRDQGGDTVSEGQAYGMLLAVAMDDRARFDSIWGWTRTHLLQPDGLLASRWAAGRGVSTRPATDADLDAAQALVLAGERFGRASYRDQGVTIARAVLDSETAATASASGGSSLVLAAGPWARNPIIVNPSYFSPRAYADLARADHDARWRLLVSSSRAIVTRLTAGGGALPPNWATLSDASASPTAIGDPGDPRGGARASSSFDAVRVAIRFASSCDPADRRLAAAMWPLYRRDPGRDAYALDGTPASPYLHAVSFVAAAAAAHAAGHRAAATRLLARAQAENDVHPSYYGSAWIALGRVMLTTAALGGCAS